MQFQKLILANASGDGTTPIVSAPFVISPTAGNGNHDPFQQSMITVKFMAEELRSIISTFLTLQVQNDTTFTNITYKPSWLNVMPFPFTTAGTNLALAQPMQNLVQGEVYRFVISEYSLATNVSIIISSALANITVLT